MNFMRNFRRKYIGDEKGQATVSSMITVAATLFIGILIISTIIGSITGLTGTANTTFNSVVGYLWTGMSFLGLGILVLGAVYIMRIIKQMGRD